VLRPLRSYVFICAMSLSSGKMNGLWYVEGMRDGAALAMQLRRCLLWSLRGVEYARVCAFLLLDFLMCNSSAMWHLCDQPQLPHKVDKSVESTTKRILWLVYYSSVDGAVVEPLLKYAVNAVRVRRATGQAAVDCVGKRREGKGWAMWAWAWAQHEED